MVIPCTFAGAPWTAKPALECNFVQLVFAQAILYVCAHFPGMQTAPLTKIVNFQRGHRNFKCGVAVYNLFDNLGAHGLQPIVFWTPNASKPHFQNLDDIYKPFAATGPKKKQKITATPNDFLMPEGEHMPVQWLSEGFS